jgi:hypothetical protein
MKLLRAIGFSLVFACLYASAQTQPATTRSASTAPALPPVTLVTLHLKDASPREAFEQLFAKSGAQLDVAPPLWTSLGDQKITVDLVDTPFLLALKELCRLTRTQPADSPDGSPTLHMIHDSTTRASSRVTTPPAVPWVDLPAVTVGPFLFAVTSVDIRSHYLFASAEHPLGQTAINLNAMIEPKFHLYACAGEIEVQEAVDESGKSLLAEQHRHLAPAPSARWTWATRAGLILSPSSHRIAHLRGVLRVQLLSRFATIEVPDLMKAGAVEKTVADLRCRIGPARTSGTRHDIPLEVFRDEQTLKQWQETSEMLRSARSVTILDADGQPIPTTHGGDYRGQDSARIHLYVSRRDHAAPAKLIWQLPEEAEEIAVPIDLKDLPLP